MKCPKCESDNTQRLEVAFHNGTQNTTATSNSAGLGFSGGRIGIAGGVSKTSAQTQSTLAIACSPPPKKSETGPAAAFVLGLFWAFLPIVFGGISMSTLPVVLGGLLVLSPLWGAGLYLLRTRSKYNKGVWPNLYQHWRESWICHKCGNNYHHA